jgi:protein O-GlcNAc transferase
MTPRLSLVFAVSFSVLILGPNLLSHSSLSLIECKATSNNNNNNKQNKNTAGSSGWAEERVVEKGRQMLEAGQNEKAVKYFEGLRKKHPEDLNVINLQANAYLRANRPLDAIREWETIVASRPEFEQVHLSLGTAQMSLGHYSKAIESFERVVALNPSSAVAEYNLGLAHNSQRHIEKAIHHYRRSLALEPNSLAAANNVGVSLMTLERFTEAIEAYRVAAKIAGGDDPRVLFNELLCLNRIAGDWDNYMHNQRRLIKAGVKVTPFHCFEFGAVLSPMECLEVTRNFVTDLVKDVHPSTKLNTHRLAMPAELEPPKRRLQVTYVHGSGFVESTTTARLLQSMFALHDRRAIEVTCLSLQGHWEKSVTREAIKAGCEHFVDVSDDQVALAKQVAGARMHIAIDLGGLTILPLPVFFRMRPAPIQINFHGFPGSMALEDLDYIVADRHVSPPHYRRLYTEKIMMMPHSYFVTSYPDKYPEVLDPANVPDRALIGLPPKGKAFVFCSFNQYYKVTPALFETWMRVLHRAKKSVLWLLNFSSDATPNLHRWAEKQGIDPRRVIITPKFEKSVEYVSKQACDLFLDASMFNGHSTLTDALWAGIPAVTTPGTAAFASRVAVSLLHAVGLEDMITPDLEAYEELAVELATSPDRHAEVKSRLHRNRLTYPLFDTARFTENFDRALECSWEIHKAKGSPMHIIVHDPNPMARQKKPKKPTKK